jgi:hypothetical protein
VGSVIDASRDFSSARSSGKQPWDLTSRLSFTTRSYSSRGLTNADVPGCNADDEGENDRA